MALRLVLFYGHFAQLGRVPVDRKEHRPSLPRLLSVALHNEARSVHSVVTVPRFHVRQKPSGLHQGLELTFDDVLRSAMA